MLFKLLNWYKTYRLEKLKLQLDAKNKPFDTLKDVAQQFMLAQSEQTKILQTWMDGFKVTEIPKPSIVRDEDEFNDEENRTYEQLYGVPAPVAKMMEKLGTDIFNPDGDM